MPSTTTTVAIALGIAAIVGATLWLRPPAVTADEQRLWDEAVAESSGNGLREYLRVHPDGAYADDARERLGACVEQTIERLGPMRDVVYPLTVQPGEVQATEGAAQKDARARGNQEAAAACAQLRRAARLLSSWARPEAWRCTFDDDGHTCGYEGQITCRLKDRTLERVERCSGG